MFESPHNKILQEDFELLAKSNTPLEELRGKTVFVTGATGLIGSQLVKSLACCNRLKGTGIRIVAFVRDEKKAKRIFGAIPDIELLVGDINNEVIYNGEIDCIIHGAGATSSRFFVEHPVETIITAINGTKNILELAREKKVDGFLYLSSLEVYGTPDDTKERIAENDYGYIDILNVRSSYSEGKRMVECLCCSYLSEYGVPVKIARLSQTFGAGVEYNDSRVFAEFARCAIEKRDIILRTRGETVRSYCYTADAVSAIFYILLRGEMGNAYNITNMSTACSVKEMAQLVCDIFCESEIAVKIDVPENIGVFGYNPEMVIKLDATRLEKLGWKPRIGLEQMLIRLVGSMKNDKNQEKKYEIRSIDS